jgi:hypothetical protein
MIIAYHGTTQEKADIIIKEGFSVGMYFTSRFEAAIYVGGPYVFGVLFKEQPSGWEWKSYEPIGIGRIVFLQKITLENILYNPKANRYLRISNMNRPCPNCEGRGEIGYPDDGQHLLPCGSMTNRGIMCPVCFGFGDLTMKHVSIKDPKRTRRRDP